VHDVASHWPFVHTSVVQSVGAPHVWEGPHFAQSAPPQSTPVSEPFRTPSIQFAARHKPPTQGTPVQSPGVTQALPALQGGQVPPQSTSVSVPSLMPLLQEASLPASGVDVGGGATVTSRAVPLSVAGMTFGEASGFPGP
jgi:hypothetical protein